MPGYVLPAEPQPVTVSSLQQAFRSALQQTGIAKAAHVHTLRERGKYKSPGMRAAGQPAFLTGILGNYAEGASLSLWERVAEGRVRVDKNALC